MKTTIGGDRLGSGNKQNVSLKNYSRSTHDLSYTWRSSMSSGTLVPFMSEVGLPGDNFDIDLSCNVLTLPTIGPLFGSYKVQLDVFSVPVRLYQGTLHMNKLGIGLDMASIMLPAIYTSAFQSAPTEEIDDNEHINASCILSYLNMRGLGIDNTGIEGTLIQRRFNALSFLSYWDIYKQYYANKQEEEGVFISSNPGVARDWSVIASTAITEAGNHFDIFNVNRSMDLNLHDITITIDDNGSGKPLWSDLYISHYIDEANEEDFNLHDNFEHFLLKDNVGIWSNYIGQTPQQLWRVESQDTAGDISVIPNSKPNLERFPLENIDTMRTNILKHAGEPDQFTITSIGEAPYSNVLRLNEDDKVTAMQYNQEGLAVKTYQSDLFNNWISTEWIDGDNGINAVTAVDTSSGEFHIDALNLANKVYNMLNRIAISGGTYDDWLDAVYTHERSKSVENPVYQGSLIKSLTFEEVISTVDTEGENAQPLGTLAGRGRMTGKNKGGKIRVKVDEPSYIMGIVSLTPLVSYSQGNKWDTNLMTMDDFHKPALDAIGYQDLITDQMAWFDTVIDTNEGNNWAKTYKSAGKQPAWINYMTNVNQVRGNFAEKNNSMFMVLNRRYENSGIDGIDDLTTYVDPSKFNHIFADKRLDAQNFWTSIGVNMKVRRKMSAKVIPNL